MYIVGLFMVDSVMLPQLCFQQAVYTIHSASSRMTGGRCQYCQWQCCASNYNLGQYSSQEAVTVDIAASNRLMCMLLVLFHIS